MAFRAETGIGKVGQVSRPVPLKWGLFKAGKRQARRPVLLILLCVTALNAQTVTVRHRHLRKGAEGVLRVTPEGIAFTETGKGRNHSRTWTYAAIQQLELGAGVLRILTYEDREFGMGRGLEYVFDHLPAGFSQSVYAQWRERLDTRFVADLPDARVVALWEKPAKLLGTPRVRQI